MTYRLVFTGPLPAEGSGPSASAIAVGGSNTNAALVCFGERHWRLLTVLSVAGCVLLHYVRGFVLMSILAMMRRDKLNEVFLVGLFPTGLAELAC